MEENLFEIELSQNGILFQLKKLEKEIEKNGILSLSEEDYKFLNELILKENINFEKEEYQLKQQQEEEVEFEISEEEEEEEKKVLHKNEEKEDLEEDNDDEKENKIEKKTKKRKREKEFIQSSFKPEEMVIIGTVLDQEQTKLLKTCIKKLGGKFVTKYNEKVTHVVTSVDEDNIVKKKKKKKLNFKLGKKNIKIFIWYCKR